MFGDGPVTPWAARLNAGSHRELAQRYYAFAVPTQEALDALAGRAPLLEMGAGAGYWASLLRQMDVDVLAYDVDPAHNRYGLSPTWTAVLATDNACEVARVHATRTLFLCWPDDHTPFAHDVLAAYTSAGGQMLAYVGEERGGCTADDSFFDLLEAAWAQFERLPLPNWPDRTDALRFYRRR